LVQNLLAYGYEVTVLDSLVYGQQRDMTSFSLTSNYRFIEGNLLDLDTVLNAMQGVQVVFHLAANSDIARGRHKTNLDLQQGTIASYHVLEAMRLHQVQEFIFASTSAVYGETLSRPTPEDAGPLFPISLYGASKLACEGLISAFVHNYGLRAWIYRFGNVVGRHATHGVIIDFIRKLQQEPHRLTILGDGKQTKPYLHVSDCVDGMMWGYQHAREPLNYFNLTSAGVTSVDRIADIVVEVMGLRGVSYTYTGGHQGWPGDVSQVCLDPTKLAILGWKAHLTSDEAVRQAAQELVEQGV
jgi:UDP-glucose 4-epimerase